jgi:hypothetical protein
VAPAPEPLTRRDESHSSTRSILGYSLVGAGAAVLGVGVYFAVLQANEFSTLKNGCSPLDACMQSSVNTIANNRVYEGVALATGVAAAGAGAVLLLTRPRAKSVGAAGESPAIADMWLVVAPAPGGGAAVAHLSF